MYYKKWVWDSCFYFYSFSNAKIEDEICFHINVTEGITSFKPMLCEKYFAKRIYVKTILFFRKVYGPSKGKS